MKNTILLRSSTKKKQVLRGQKIVHFHNLIYFQALLLLQREILPFYHIFSFPESLTGTGLPCSDSILTHSAIIKTIFILMIVLLLH